MQIQQNFLKAIQNFKNFYSDCGNIKYTLYTIIIFIVN